MTVPRARQVPLVAVVDFHHARGPEIEHWFGTKDGEDPSATNDWALLPFMALSDGAHAATEDFSYFTLRKKEIEAEPATSLFGISCTRQIAASDLIHKSPDVTRSTVQKAVVVITDEPQYFGQLRERLSAVTLAWFSQKDFSDSEILKHFQDSLATNLQYADKDQNLGLSLREMIYEFKYQTLVLFKCCLLQPKMLFFSTRCERLCMIQFSLITLIPGLINNLQDCADPALDNYTKSLVKPTSLKTSDRNSLLAYMGLPLQLFGKGGFFGPYTPLQQLDMLADFGTKSYIVGSTNSLLLQQKDKYSDILVHLDDLSVNITSSSLKAALVLSAADRRWIDFLAQTVADTWDPANPSRPNTMGYIGSEEFIRLQFEEYLLALLSCISYHHYLKSNPPSIGQLPRSGENTPNPANSDPALDFGEEFIHAWSATANYALFESITRGSDLFDIITPRHPTAGGLGIEDIQRRLAQQVSELHLDERLKEGKEALNKTLASGQKTLAAGRERVSEGIGKLWADLEAMREAQRKKSADRSSGSDYPTLPADDAKSISGVSVASSTGKASTSAATSRFGSFSTAWTSRTQTFKAPSVDMGNVQEKATAARAQAGAYLSSWGSWATEKRKNWQEKRGSTTEMSSPTFSETSFQPVDITPKVAPSRAADPPIPIIRSAPSEDETLPKAAELPEPPSRVEVPISTVEPLKKVASPIASEAPVSTIEPSPEKVASPVAAEIPVTTEPNLDKVASPVAAEMPVSIEEPSIKVASPTTAEVPTVEIPVSNVDPSPKQVTSPITAEVPVSTVEIPTEKPTSPTTASVTSPISAEVPVSTVEIPTETIPSPIRTPIASPTTAKAIETTASMTSSVTSPSAAQTVTPVTFEASEPTHDSVDSAKNGDDTVTSPAIGAGAEKESEEHEGKAAE